MIIKQKLKKKVKTARKKTEGCVIFFRPRAFLCKMTPFINEQYILHPGKILKYIPLNTKNMVVLIQYEAGW